MNNKYYRWHWAAIKLQAVKKYYDQRWLEDSDSMLSWFFINFEHFGCFEQSLGNAMRKAALFSRVTPLFHALLSLTVLSRKPLFFQDGFFTFRPIYYGVEGVFPPIEVRLRNKSSFFAVVYIRFGQRKLSCMLTLPFICYLCLDFTQNFVELFSILHNRGLGSKWDFTLLHIFDRFEEFLSPFLVLCQQLLFFVDGHNFEIDFGIHLGLALTIQAYLFCVWETSNTFFGKLLEQFINFALGLLQECAFFDFRRSEQRLWDHFVIQNHVISPLLVHSVDGYDVGGRNPRQNVNVLY